MVPGLDQRAFRRFFTAVAALLILVSIGAAGYHLIEGMPPVDAFYMTVITLSTVGFGEIHPLSQAGRMFTIGLIVAGGGLAAYALSGLAEYLVSGEWQAHLRAQRRLRMLEELSNHVIVCGYGRVGRHLAHELKGEGVACVVIDVDPHAVELIQAAGFLGVLGDAADEHKLREAGVARARGLVAAANSDAENVFIVLTARTLRPDMLIIARTNDGLELLVDQVRLLNGSPLVGKRLAEVQLSSRLGVTVLACRSDDGQWNTQPGADTILSPNTDLIALGTPEQLQSLMKFARSDSSRNGPAGV
jgi:voltage-gated potassium channel